MQVLLSTYFQLLDLSGLFLTACLIYIFSYRKTTGLQPIHLTLTGIGFSFALSGTMIVIISSAERVKVDFIAKWIAGNIWGDDWVFVLAILPWLAILIPFILYKANRLNILALNEPVAIGVGIELEKRTPLSSPSDCGIGRQRRFSYRRHCLYRSYGSAYCKIISRA
ncbi:iron chelate uptake ABC transporter family permease subunit [Bacillus cytotoxicus]